MSGEMEEMSGNVMEDMRWKTGDGRQVMEDTLWKTRDGRHVMEDT